MHEHTRKRELLSWFSFAGCIGAILLLFALPSPVAAQPPPGPVLSGPPQNGLVSPPPRLIWQQVDDPDGNPVSYRVFSCHTTSGACTPQFLANVAEDGIACPNATGFCMYQINDANSVGWIYYWYIVAVDGTFETGQSATRNFSVIGPDLTVTALGWPATVNQGQSANFTFMVTNNGLADAGSFVDALFVDNMQVPGQNRTINSLSAGQSNTTGFAWTGTTCGAHTVQVRTDVNGQITEGNENNNTAPLPPATHTITVSCSAQPDLTVEKTGAWSASTTGTGAIGVPMVFPFTVRNGGTAAGGFMITRLFVNNAYSAPEEFYSSSISPGGSTPPPGASCSANDGALCWTPASAGTYIIQIKTDTTAAQTTLDCSGAIAGNAAESNEANNCLPVAYTVTVGSPAPQPDLTSVVFPITTPPAVGAVVSFPGSVKNEGAANAGASSARFCLDGTAAACASGTGTTLGNLKSVSALVPNAVTSVTSDTWPATAGSHTIHLCADGLGVVAESVETNNCSSTAFTVSGPAPQPDLTIAALGWPTTATQSQSVNFSFMTTNSGTGNAGAFIDALFVDGAQLAQRTVSGLNAGQGDTSGLAWTATCGTHSVQVRTDATGQIAESNENNNTSPVPAQAVTVACPLPSLTITATDAAAAESGTPANNPGTFTVIRTGATTAPLTVNFNWSTGAGQAQLGVDFTVQGLVQPNLITIPAGQASAAITVVPIDDSVVESSESATLTLVSSLSYTFSPPTDSATVTIADNDSAPLPDLVDPNLDCDAAPNVDVFDLALLMSFWGKPGPYITACGKTADYITTEAGVGIAELGRLAECWGRPSSCASGAPQCTPGGACNVGTCAGTYICQNNQKVCQKTDPNCGSSTLCDVNATVGQTHWFKAQATDPQNDPLYYLFNWDSAQVNCQTSPALCGREPASGTVNSGTQVTASHAWSVPGIYQVAVTASDPAGNASPASAPVRICIPTPAPIVQ